MTEVLDYYAVQNRATLQCFKAGGAAGIAHYLTASMSDPREINRQELADSHAVGLAVHLVYEMNPTRADYFTFAQGAEDCRQAQDRLGELGAPDGTIAYFTVDVNIDPNLTTEYFNGVESAVTPRIAPGCYGYQAMCEFAFKRFPLIGKHLWQTYGTPTVPLELWQHLQETRCGVEVDVNEASIPGWKQEEDMTTPQELWDGGLAKIVQDTVVAPQADTNTAIKAALALLAAHQREGVNAGDLAASVTAQIEQSLRAVLTDAVPPIPPSCPPGTAYYGQSADGSVVGWTYPGGVTHYWKNGVDQTPSS